MTRGIVGWCVFLLVSVLISYGMQMSGVPWWIRSAVTFGLGWTCATPLMQLFNDKGEK